MPEMEAITDIDVQYPLASDRIGNQFKLWVTDIEPIWVKLTARVENVTDADGVARTAYRGFKQQKKGGGQFVDSDDKVEFYPSGLSQPQQPIFSATEREGRIGDVVRIYPGVRDKATSPTTNHGLEWWFYGGPQERALLKIEPWGNGVPDPQSSDGYRAKLQKWVPTSPYFITTYPDNSHWDDVSPTVYVRVRDPNAARFGNFAPGEYVWGQFVETLPGGTDLYERSGLDGLQVLNNSGPWYQNDQNLFADSFVNGVRSIGFGQNFYVNNYGPGASIFSLAPASSIGGGQIAAGGYFGGVPPADYTPYQWIRDQFSGLTTIGTRTILLSPNTPPAVSPMLSVDFDTWAAVSGTSGTTSISGGGGTFAIGMGLQGDKFTITEGASTGSGGTVQFGNVSNAGIYDNFFVYSKYIRFRSPGANPYLFESYGETYVKATVGGSPDYFYAGALAQAFHLMYYGALAGGFTAGHDLTDGLVYAMLVGQKITLDANTKVNGNLNVTGNLTVGGFYPTPPGFGYDSGTDQGTVNAGAGHAIRFGVVSF